MLTLRYSDREDSLPRRRMLLLSDMPNLSGLDFLDITSPTFDLFFAETLKDTGFQASLSWVLFRI